MSAADMRNPLKRARGLGSAHSGVGHWWTQRVTAAALVLLALWFLAFLLGLLHADYAQARAELAHPLNALLLALFIATMFWHAVLGLQVVIEDYVHTRWRAVLLLVLIRFIAVLAAGAGILSVLRIALA